MKEGNDDFGKKDFQKADTDKDEKSDSETKSPEAEILEDLPPEIREIVRTGISMQRISGPLPNPLLSKINEKHIDKILELAENEDRNSYKDAQSSKKYGLFYFLIIIGLFIFITLYLAKEDKALFTDIIKIVVSLAGGFGGGYGYKAYLDSKKRN